MKRERSRSISVRLLVALVSILFVLCAVASGAFGFSITKIESKFETRFGLSKFEIGSATQAGSHPYLAGARVEFPAEGDLAVGNVRNVDVELPAGLVGDPSATPECEPAALTTPAGCPADTQIGLGGALYGPNTEEGFSPLYNLKPPPGVPAEFGFVVAQFVPVIVTAGVRPAAAVGTEGSGLDLHIHEISQALSVRAASISFFGAPPNGTVGKPFVTLPTSCGRQMQIRIYAESWEGETASASTLVTDVNGNPVTIGGCDRVPFEPKFSTGLDTTSADSPSGLTVDIKTPQNTNPSGIASANLRSTTVTLPAGVSINPSAADGRLACAVAQFDRFGEGPSTCPEASKVGSVQIQTPILPDPVVGGVYLAKQTENPFGSLIALYLVAEADGVRIKLPGDVSADPTTGQLTATFQETPQLPFEELKLHFFDGPRAALATPVTCGTRPVAAALTPWSRDEAVSLSSTLAVTSGVAGSACPSSAAARPFALGFQAGTVSPAAALHSPFDLDVTRPDGAQELDRIEAVLPEGLLATLKGVQSCSASAAATGTCGAASQVGSLVVGAGAGPDPYHVEGGRAYLTGPYGGAPFGLDFVVPAVAGPLNLGTVNVRAALFIDPVTTKVTVRSDPLPRILQGIPLRLRSVAIDVDRQGFVVNPTSCDPMSVTGRVTGTEGATTDLADRFQAAGCGSLAFAPNLRLSLRGGTRRNGNPALTAVLTQPGGQANLGRVSVALPRSEFLEQNHIRTVCTRVQFAADACPKGSVYGTAEVVTPLLGSPLRGPVYLRSSSHTLPDLVAALKGPASEPVEVDLGGRIDSVRGAIRTTFEGIPDAPVSKFVLRLRGGKKSLLVNSTDVCRGAGKATVKMTGQNGALHDVKVPLGAGCGKSAKKAGGGGKRSHR